MNDDDQEALQRQMATRMAHLKLLDEPNGIVEPIHEKAMPVLLMTPDDVEQWLRGGSVEDALQMQKPAPDEAIVIRPPEKKAA